MPSGSKLSIFTLHRPVQIGPPHKNCSTCIYMSLIANLLISKPITEYFLIFSFHKLFWIAYCSDFSIGNLFHKRNICIDCLSITKIVLIVDICACKHVIKGFQYSKNMVLLEFVESFICVMSIQV